MLSAFRLVESFSGLRSARRRVISSGSGVSTRWCLDALVYPPQVALGISHQSDALSEGERGHVRHRPGASRDGPLDRGGGVINVYAAVIFDGLRARGRDELPSPPPSWQEINERWEA